MTTPTKEDLEKLLAEVTPGPWGVSAIGLTNDGGKPITNADRRVAVADAAVDLPKKQMWQAECSERDANARLIAIAPTLAARVIALEAENASLTAERAAIAAQPAQGEAVAWCLDDDFGFAYTRIKRVAEIWRDQGCVVTPLYTHPAPTPPATSGADLDALVEVGSGLRRIVEEIDGAMNHGTWRDEHGMRLKDTPEWVEFYNTLTALRAKLGEVR